MTTTTPAAISAAPRWDLRDLAERYGLLLLVVALFALFALLPESSSAFINPRNIRALVSNQSVGLVVAIALLFRSPRASSTSRSAR